MLERLEEQREPSAAAGAPPAPPASRATPDWTRLSAKVLSDAEFSALRAKVQAEPRDRAKRNAYAEALAQALAWDALQAQCFEWLPFDPENPQIYEYLGKSAAGLKDEKTALRALSSIAEIAPRNAALLGRAGWVLLSVKQHVLAEMLFREALLQRQDDPNLHRGLALAAWLQPGGYAKAVAIYEAALKIDFNARYGDVKRVLREEAAYVVRSAPWKEGLVPDFREEWTRRLGLDLKRTDALRVTLGWETDANDVDLHVVDPNNEECFYSHKQNASGLKLYSDQTQGLGPEVIRCAKALPGTYHMGVKYFSAGPMGVSRGVIVVFQSKDGVVNEPLILPFCLLPESGAGKEMRHLAVVKF